MPKPLNIGLVGFGNIGAGVVRALASHGALIDGRLPHPLRLTRIVDKDLDTKREAEYDPAILSDDLDALLADPDIHVVLELTGAIDFGRELIRRALESGKHVVTANKALIAIHGMELMQLAASRGLCLLFEAAVGGGIPLIRTLHTGLAQNRITAVRGIINGTANYILTRMTDEGLAFDAVLEEAKRLGYAEPDPTFDVEGHDTAHKIAILATLCFGQDLRFDDVALEGISRIAAIDIDYARRRGYAIKLLGIAKRSDDGSVELRVHPTLLPQGARLASVGGVYNAVRIDGDLTGSVLLSGRGAGPEPTAGAILSDLMVLSSGLAEGGLGREMRLCLPNEDKNLRPIEELETRYYLRFGVEDRSGVLAQVTGVLGAHEVSVATMEQPPEAAGEDYATVVLTTHCAREASVQAALAEIAALEVNRTEPFLLRIEDVG